MQTFGGSAWLCLGGKLLFPRFWLWTLARSVKRLACEAVRAVVEIVFPSMVSIEEAVKPVLYADAGISVCWRVI
jgi:hypothetical protein